MPIIHKPALTTDGSSRFCCNVCCGFILELGVGLGASFWFVGMQGHFLLLGELLKRDI
jgi:hypothetical protein